MAIPIDPTTHNERLLRDLAYERKIETEGMNAAWAFLWVLFGFKMATVGVILYVASRGPESFTVVFATTWYWFIIPILALSGPLMIRWRMMKMRRRRDALRRSEWDVDGVEDEEHGT